MTATVSGIHLSGTHAARPAAAGPPAGTLYSCTSDNLIYRTDGTSWSTWATLGGVGGSVATDAIWDAAGDLAVGSGANTAARLAIGAAGGYLSRFSGAVGWNAGTAFPGSPATGDRYYRTNIRGGMSFLYDGTRWLSEQEFHMIASTYAAVTATTFRDAQPLPTDYKIYVTTIDYILYFSGTGVWEGRWSKMLWDESSYPDINAKSTTGLTAARWYSFTNTVDTEIDGTLGNSSTNATGLVFNLTEISGTATQYGGSTLRYRLIAT